jgi:hypothetical protein
MSSKVKSTIETKNSDSNVSSETSKKSNKKQTSGSIVAPVVAETTSVAPVETIETVAPKQRGGKKSQASVTETPVVAESTAVAQVTPKQRGGKKSVKATETTSTTASTTASTTTLTTASTTASTDTTSVVQKAGKRKPKVVEEKAEVVEASIGEQENVKEVRSFKVQLPGLEDYIGRFTGLTPYQAANKALSKFFRENKLNTSEIKFSIRESTRGSKRLTYTYNGRREKLETPVKYAIKNTDGNMREIIKEYKNRLIKIKKNDNVVVQTSAPASA